MPDYQLQASIYKGGSQPERVLLNVGDLARTLGQGDFETLVLYEGSLRHGQSPHQQIAISRECAREFAAHEDFGPGIVNLLGMQSMVVVSDSYKLPADTRVSVKPGPKDGGEAGVELVKQIAAVMADGRTH